MSYYNIPEELRAYEAPDDEDDDLDMEVWNKEVPYAVRGDGGKLEMVLYTTLSVRRSASGEKKFKVSTLKKLCWIIGSTTQLRKYNKSITAMSRLNPKAWEYLKSINEDKWTIVKYKNNRRWGNLTTNISESFNNALGGIRLMPIKAIINCAFEKSVEQWLKNTEIAYNCNTRLPPRTWTWFEKRDARSREHQLKEFDYRQGKYKVVSKIQPNYAGGNDYTVEYKKCQCTCGRWQMQRFPCSHAITVRHNRGDSLKRIVHVLYTTDAYKAQYDRQFFLLAHSDYWTDPGWRVKGDTSKITTSCGRRRSRRIHNEMDVRHPDQPRVFRCGTCKQIGHKNNACESSHQ
ncbi:uncharacterized protein LOC143548336 [Bidens hawaiensis]|uniref:uncharacterized protein LOC143548336 n=1 Tax=Bidens hawaiensis TaxID=980011 RepID=UPI0040492896